MTSLVVCASDGPELQRVELDQGEWLIGRQDGNHIVLPSSSVSRQHARIYSAHGRFYVQDLNSANGVIVDNRRIDDAVEMPPQQPVLIGDYLLYLDAELAGSGSAPSPVSTYIVPQDREFPRLVGLSGPFEGEEFSLTEADNTIGRTEENFVLLPDPSISRRHARIVQDEKGRYVIFDLHSSNGCFVNRKQVQRALIRHGDVVTVGSINFRFVESGRGTQSGLAALVEGGRTRSIIVVGLVASLLLMAGATVGLVLYRSQKRKQARLSVEESFRRNALVGKQAVADRRWEDAVNYLSRAVSVDPTSRDLVSLLARARAERDHAAHIKRGDELFAAGKLSDALATFGQVAPSSVRYGEAKQKMETAKQQLVKGNLAEFKLRCRKRSTRACHQLLLDVLAHDPDNRGAQRNIRTLERKLKRLRIEYRPYRQGTAK